MSQSYLSRQEAGIPGVNEAHDKELRLLLHSHFAFREKGDFFFVFFQLRFGM